ncbi:MAG: MOSC domain-containing protein, partial [Chloroflexota bacterium]
GNGVDRADLGGSVSLATVASLAELAAVGGLDEPLDQRRFRMTIGIGGVRAWAEDAWLGHEVRVGGAVVRPEGNVGRCATTTQDPDTGTPDVDTLGLLSRLRGDVATTEPLPFGVWASVVTPGLVRLGDPVAPPDAAVSPGA